MKLLEIIKYQENTKFYVNSDKKVKSVNQELDKSPVIIILETLHEFKKIESSIELHSSKYILLILTNNIFTNFSEVVWSFGQIGKNCCLMSTLWFKRKMSLCFLRFSFQ